MKNKKNNFIVDCIEKPILPVVISIFISFFGFFFLSKLEIRNKPKTPANHFVIYTTSINPKTPEEMNKVTRKIQKKIANIADVDMFYSSSEGTFSKIDVEFKDGVQEEKSFSELKSIIASAKLDYDIRPPEIFSQNSDDSVMNIDLFINNENIKENNSEDEILFFEMSNLIKNVLLPSIKKVDGVGNVEIIGSPKQYFSIEFDPFKVAKYGLFIRDIERIISQETSIKSYSNVETDTKTISLSSDNNIKTKYDLENIIIDIKKRIKVKHIGKVLIHQKEISKFSLLNGKIRTIKIIIYKTTNGNPLEINKKIKLLLGDLISKDFHYKIKNNYENSEIIFQKTIRTLIEAIILLFFVLIFFLGSIKILFLPIIAIPLSILGTFFFMYFFSCSINEITLMAFLLAIGLLVDDAILVIERIERQRHEEGKISNSVIINATLDIYKPVIVMTATLFCVFLPVIFLPGSMGSTLKEFALTISISVGFSCLFSLILTPVMCKYFMKNYFPFHWVEVWLNFLEKIYIKILKFFLNHKKKTIFITIGFTLFSFYLLKFIKNEYNPYIVNKDFSIYTNRLENFKVDFLKKEAEDITNILNRYENEIEYFYIDLSNGDITIRGRTKNDKELILKKIKEDLKKEKSNIEFLFYETNNNQINTYLCFSTYKDKEILKYKMEEFLEKLMDTKKIVQYYYIKNNNFSYSIEIDTKKCEYKNIEVEQIKNIIDYWLQSHKLSGNVNFSENKKYKIIFNHNKFMNQQAVTNSMKELKFYPFLVSDRYGRKHIISLHDIISIKSIEKENNIQTMNGLDCSYVRIICAPEITVGEIYKTIMYVKKNFLEKDIYLNFTNEIREYEKNSSSLIYVFLACLLSIFLILSVQFNSFFKSIFIMLTVPLAFTGAIINLYFFGTININSIIGSITLIALITKHGILFMNSEGNILDIARQRLRPVLMTTIAMILGNIPLLLYQEEVMVPLKQMAYVIVPGLSYGTIMILILFPLVLSFNKKNN